MTCFSWIILLAVAVLLMVSLLRWFEQVTEAVERGWWNKVFVLIAAPFTVWLFPARVAAGRPTAVPRHEPVRGFGTIPLATGDPHAPPPAGMDGPPPGTPKEFIGLPPIPPKKKSRPPVEQDKLDKLRQKMSEQGMLDDEE
jgi:hypothetical protein